MLSLNILATFVSLASTVDMFLLDLLHKVVKLQQRFLAKCCLQPELSRITEEQAQMVEGGCSASCRANARWCKTSDVF